MLVFRRDHSSSLMLAENPNSFNLVHWEDTTQWHSLFKEMLHLSSNLSRDIVVY